MWPKSQTGQMHLIFLRFFRVSDKLVLSCLSTCPLLELSCWYVLLLLLRLLNSRDVVSVLNVSVSRRFRDVFWNVSSCLGLEALTSRSRLGLEDITSRSRSRDFSLVNMHAMRIYHEENNGSDPRKNSVVKWQTLPVGVYAVSRRFLERLGLVSVLWLNVLWTSLVRILITS